MRVKVDFIVDERISRNVGGAMLHSERVITAEQGAHMVGLTLASFRNKVSRLRIKGKKDGRNVFYTLAEITRTNKRSAGRRKSTPTKRKP